MWQFIRSRILTVIIFISVAHGILVVGPKFIRANQDYTVVISNFKNNLTRVNLLLQIECFTDDGTNILNLTKMVDVRQNSNRMINFKMPESLSAGNYRITIEGQSGFGFHKEADLVYLGKSISGLIQIDKPVFNPSDTVRFRVIVLDTALKPPARVKAVDVSICDSKAIVIRQWSSAKLYAGVFESELQISPTPMLGMWSISVQVDGEVLSSKTFEVKEYELPSFDVEVLPTVIPLEEHQSLNLTITANYHFRKPVKGLVKVELYLEDDFRDQMKEFEMYGIHQVELRFVETLEIQEHWHDVRVKTTFIEQTTNRTVMKESQIRVYKYLYRVELLKDIPFFRSRHLFHCAFQFRYHDGTPAKGITGKVEVMDIEYETTATSDDEGFIKLELNPRDNTDQMYITFSNNDDGFYFYERVDKVDAVTKVHIKLELNSPVKVNQLLQFWVTCNERMTFFVYYVLSKGNIIRSGYERLNQQNKYPLRFTASDNMMPKSNIIVATVVNETLLFDHVEIDFEHLRNNFALNMDKEIVQPGQQVDFRLSGRSGAYVGLAVYDKDLLHYNQNHDLFWEDVMRVYNGFGSKVEHEFDKFHSMGLFVKVLDDVMFNEAHDSGTRIGLEINDPITTQESYRTNLQESWLWQNVTIGRSGTHTMTAVVPDRITSWYLTAFSIDPMYGLGIIKKPIQFTTTQQFYIVENLPYSIKRGEAVELQFTLFNNLGEEHIADVTLYNVFNQTEFIGRPVEDLSYTKSVSVPPKVGVPISFLVKALSLGEMTVRVKAMIKSIQKTDLLEKVIRVMPESLAQKKMDSRFFCHATYTNQTFQINLNLSKKAENGSIKIEFRLNPNLLTSVVGNLDNLLHFPGGNGESNMVDFVPSLMVLDYLHAIGSKDQSLIDKATNYSRKGYPSQMCHRETDGSFGAWRDQDSCVFLTAFVAKSIQIASKYISEVDAAMVEEACDWLASKQHSSGRFDEIGSAYRKDMQGSLGDGVRLTSFVVTALLENENSKVKHAAVINRAMNYISSLVDYLDDPYELSIATYALMLHGHWKKDKEFKQLIDMSTVTSNGAERYWESTNKIEATGYALLSFVIAEKYVEAIPVMRWLVDQIDNTRDFPRIQETFVVLTAVTKLAEKISPSRNDYSIYLKYKKGSKYFRINSQDTNIINFNDIPQDTKSLEINVGGIGSGMLQVIYQYSLNLVNFEQRFKLDLEKQTTNSSYELRLKVCVSFISEVPGDRSNMALIEVTFPSGYNVDPNPISEQTSINPIQNTEIRYGGTSVVVYYNSMGIERNCFTVTAYRRGKVAMKRPAYVVVYDYYDQERNAIKEYEVDE